jgi:hypothetical protein
VSAKVKWTAAIVGLLLANLIAMAILIGSANSDGGARVLPEYKAHQR